MSLVIIDHMVGMKKRKFWKVEIFLL